MKKTSKNNPLTNIIVSLLCLVLGFAVSFVGVNALTMPQNDKFLSGNLKIHFFEMDTTATGDCFLIQVNNTEILVDGGSEAKAIPSIYNYVSSQITDNVIEYAIITHAHADHIAGFAGDGHCETLFDKFTFNTIIDFPKTNSTSAIYQRYVNERTAEVNAGAKHFTALECYNNQNGATRTFKLTENTQLRILYNYYYDHEGDENNYSVCFQIEQNEKTFIFTGDLEKDGEKKLIANNDLSKVELFKANHHGSNTSNCEQFLNKIQPKIVVIPCIAGTTEYTIQESGIFPTQQTIENIAPHTNKVYCPTQAIVSDPTTKNKFTTQSLNGNIVITSSNTNTTVSCSVSDKVLKDTNWFKNNRELPASWQ